MKITTVTENRIDGTIANLNIKLALKLAGNWGFIATLVIGCLAAGVWTLIPTEFLTWGSSKTNLLGYVSHCPFAPLSSLALFGISLAEMMVAVRMPGKNPVGYTVFITGILGILTGMLVEGIGTNMFIAGGIGIVMGIVLVIAFELFKGMRR
ncbi:MAG: hypothetical protein ACFFD4_18030 [Candidatus Odinarchaeota archaeon]